MRILDSNSRVRSCDFTGSRKHITRLSLFSGNAWDSGTEKFFTKREVEIIIEIEKGQTNKKIGEKLQISEYTVATHRKHIFKKSNCHNSKELLLFCREKCII